MTSACPPMGTTVQLDLLLYASDTDEARTTRIKTQATVTRVENSLAAKGFAAVSRDFRLVVGNNGGDAVHSTTYRTFTGNG